VIVRCLLVDFCSVRCHWCLQMSHRMVIWRTLDIKQTHVQRRRVVQSQVSGENRAIPRFIRRIQRIVLLMDQQTNQRIGREGREETRERAVAGTYSFAPADSLCLMEREWHFVVMSMNVSCRSPFFDLSQNHARRCTTRTMQRRASCRIGRLAQVAQETFGSSITRRAVAHTSL
jgi:hypothetical protein